MAQASTGTAAKANEPSMEEILASIRRIIADDDPKAAPSKPAAEKPSSPPPAPAPEASPASQDDIDALLAGFDAPEPVADVLDLTDAVAPKMVKPLAESADLSFEEAMEAAAPPPPPQPAPRVQPAPVRAVVPMDEPNALLSGEAHAAVGAAFGSLANTVFNANGRTIDDLVKEMLKPMLKVWLDDNLPQMVERLVRAEIERVSRGR